MLTSHVQNIATRHTNSMFTVYGPICLRTHANTTALKHTLHCVLSVPFRACSSSSSECYLLLSVCVTCLVTLGPLHTSYHRDRQQPPPPHRHTHAPTYMHIYKATSVVENLKTVREMAILILFAALLFRQSHLQEASRSIYV